MANPHKGEVEFEAGGEKFTLRFSADAICNVEDALGKTLNELGEVFQDPKRMRMSMVRIMFVHAIKDRHPDFDDARAGGVFKQLLPPEALRLVVLAFNRSFGADEAGEVAADANPPKPGETNNGTGPAS